MKKFRIQKYVWNFQWMQSTIDAVEGAPEFGRKNKRISWEIRAVVEAADRNKCNTGTLYSSVAGRFTLDFFSSKTEGVEQT